jgi:cell division protein FtsB
MDTYVIIAVIVAPVLATAAIAMVILLLYYHWRNKELLTNFSAFIRENLKLKDEIGRLQEENSELNEELNKTK